MNSEPPHFCNNLQPNAHELFQEWRRKNPDGFVLAENTKTLYKLHHTNCPHFDEDTSDSEVWCLTKKLKVCSLNQLELKKWARAQNAEPKDCETCM